MNPINANNKKPDGIGQVKNALNATGNAAMAAGKIPIDAVKTTISVEKGGIKVLQDGRKMVENTPPAKRARSFWRGLGPGLITGAADDDPSGIGTYSQTGAKYGFQLLWLAPLSFPLMAVIQEMCARIGIATGQGLASNIRAYFPRWVLVTTAILLLAANSFNIGADLGAMAKATQLLTPQVSFTLLVFFFAGISLLMQIFISYGKYARYLKFLALVLLVYVVTAFMIKDFNWLDVFKSTIIPHMDFTKDQMILICGIFGTTISPYLFFWETSQEVEEKILQGQTSISQRKNSVNRKEIKKMRIDVWVGMLLSNLAMFFIIATCGATLFRVGINNVNTAAEAAAALKPLAGNYASLLFTIGILGVGLLGIPTLAGSASYAISESFGWKEGLYRNFREAWLFYGVIIFSVLVGLVMNFVGLDPIKTLIYAAVFNGLVAPVILVLICLLSSNKKVMGEHANGGWTKTIGWFATILMIVVAIATIYSFF